MSTRYVVRIYSADGSVEDRTEMYEGRPFESLADAAVWASGWNEKSAERLHRNAVKKELRYLTIAVAVDREAMS